MGPFTAGKKQENMSYSDNEDRRSEDRFTRDEQRPAEEQQFKDDGPAGPPGPPRPAEDYDGPPGMRPDGEIQSTWDEVTDNFDDMNLREKLLRGIYAYGFEKPSAIQQRAIIPCIKRHDVIAQAQSGTGKTATFSIAILQQVDIALGDYMEAQCHACIGGTNVREDIAKLSSGVHVVVGTPGRVFDMINRRALNTRHIKM